MRTSSDVVPILIVRSQFLVGTGLDDVDPRRDLDLTYRARTAERRSTTVSE